MPEPIKLMRRIYLKYVEQLLHIKYISCFSAWYTKMFIFTEELLI